MKWNILVIRGEETKKYSVSTGEGMWKKNKIFKLQIFSKFWKNYVI